jgi:hypothetical protein
MWSVKEMGIYYDEEPVETPGGKKPQWGFRPDPDVQAYLQPAKSKGRGVFTRAVMRLLRIGRDVYEVPGATYKEMSEWAKAQGMTEGEGIARLAMMGWRCRNEPCAQLPPPKKKK